MPRIPKLVFPFPGTYPISLPFGSLPPSNDAQEKYTMWKLKGHDGIDFALPEGTHVCSVGNGKIIQCDEKADFGLSLTIKHSWGESFYAHLMETKVSIGSIVKKGQSIALSGKSGYVTGAHLHFGIKPKNHNLKNGYHGFVDPLPYFP